jgi:hypothetical protein
MARIGLHLLGLEGLGGYIRNRRRKTRTRMDIREQRVIMNRLRIAEQQFRLACTVNLAVTNDVQALTCLLNTGGDASVP